MIRNAPGSCLAARLIVFALVVGACGSNGEESSSTATPQIIVTYPVLATVVEELVGDTVDVVVLMPNGSDPHEWSPSAKDVAANGVPVFTVADHITIRGVKAGEGADPSDEDQAPGAEDPHLWMDPETMKQWVAPLAAELQGMGNPAADGTYRSFMLEITSTIADALR